jgi:NAD(P)-dependent dehydrogenase (short-subunit alcohol dehydrogenase family)
MQLEAGKIAVVTGAGSGIGLALCDAMARQGCSIVLADVQADALTAATEQIAAHGVETLAMLTDVSKADQVEALAQATLDRFGAVHIVCNNAGVTSTGDPWFGPIESWEWTMGVNFWGVVYGVRAFLPHLIAAGGGHIVNTASIAGLWPGLAPPYDASKHAVVALTEDLYNTMQAAEMPIGVSVLCPGWVRTGILEAERNWPAELGDAPVIDPIQEISLDHVRRAVAEGTQPGAVADLVLDAIASDRYWVFPNPDFLELAVERFHTIGEGINPVPPEQVPGLPPRSEMMAEMMAAMAASLEDG